MTPRAEVVTMTTQGLAAFLKELERVKGECPSGRGPLVKTATFGVSPMILKSKDGMMTVTGAPADGVAGHIGSLNRTVNPNRVTEYRNAMWRGEWWFTPDPIVVTDEGFIINGQHRLLAAEEVAKSVKVGKPEEHAPSFVVVWNVDRKAAILMDEARRTATDRRDIALRYAGSR
jgi:hypothetical protein